MSEAGYPDGIGEVAATGGFWTGTTGDGPDSDFLDEVCCPTPGGAPVCVPEPAAAAGAAAAALGLAALRARRIPLRGLRA